MPDTLVCNIESNDKIGKILHQLVKVQLDSSVNIDMFDGNPNGRLFHKKTSKSRSKRTSKTIHL